MQLPAAEHRKTRYFKVKPNSSFLRAKKTHRKIRYILNQAEAKGLSNITVFTGDVSEFDRDDWTNKFDRIISLS